MEYNGYKGLTSSEVEESRRKYGSNVLTEKKRQSLLTKFFLKFKDPMIVVLLVAAILSMIISFYEYFRLQNDTSIFIEPLGIFFAIILATGLSFLFELKAEKEFKILNRVNDDEPVEVIRNGCVHQISKKSVVVGDIVFVDAGSEIPADGELLESVRLIVDESSLTGESSCSKTTDESKFDKLATYPSNHVYRGTKVQEGHALFRVLRVGDLTEYGTVFEASLIDNSVKTPLNEQLQGLGRFITIASYIIAGIIIVGRIVRFLSEVGGSLDIVEFVSYVLRSFMLAVTVVVVAVPEGLPMAVTLCLAYSMRRMLKTNNLVRKLHACETMGAATVICTDKTGTLTKNRMEVSSTFFYTLGEKQELSTSEESFYVVEGISVNSTAQLDLSFENPKLLGNPTEAALLLWLYKNGYNYSDYRCKAGVLNEIPFSADYKFMASEIISSCGKRILYIKGAPEVIYSLCSVFPENHTEEEIFSQLHACQSQAMRTLAFGYKILDDDEVAIDGTGILVGGIVFVGFVSLADSVREDVKEAVKECMDAGIGIKIITGDNPITTRRIAQEIGLFDDESDDNAFITGPEFEAIPEDQLAERTGKIKIISRAKPMDKKRLVNALMKNGDVVAVTGDGTNDAPALKAAHVGLSMGSGTGVAKEASDITIMDDSFSSITKAVMWGRSLYLNIQRFLLFQLTVNLAACLVVLISSLMGHGSLLNVTQMLWVNLIMDTFAAVAFASLPPEERVMKFKPRNRYSFIITKRMTRIIIMLGLTFAVTLLAGYCVLLHGEFEEGSLMNILNFKWTSYSKGEVTPYEHSLFFNLFVMLQFWNMFNAKAFLSGKGVLNFDGCRGFLFIMILILAGQILIINYGGAVFHVKPLELTDWIISFVVTSPVLLLGSLVRWTEKLIKNTNHD